MRSAVVRAPLRALNDRDKRDSSGPVLSVPPHNVDLLLPLLVCVTRPPHRPRCSRTTTHAEVMVRRGHGIAGKL
jgi:hypothetical protein